MACEVKSEVRTLGFTLTLYTTASVLRAAPLLNFPFHNHFIFLPRRPGECCTILHMAATIIAAVPLPSPGSNGGVMDERVAPVPGSLPLSLSLCSPLPWFFFPCCSCADRKPRSSPLPPPPLSLSTKWPGGVDVSGEALLLAPLDCNLATLKENASPSVFPSASSSLEINCYPAGSF